MRCINRASYQRPYQRARHVSLDGDIHDGWPAFPEPKRSGPSSAPADASDDPALRHTDIHFMGDMQWGTHICMFYETPEDLLDAALSYFEAGLKSNEFCVWAVSDPLSQAQAEEALRRSIPDFDRHWAADQIEQPRTEAGQTGDRKAKWRA